MNLKESIQTKPEEFMTLCKSYDVKSLYAFGSTITDRFQEDTSDIDLLIELNTDDLLKRGRSVIKFVVQI